LLVQESKIHISTPLALFCHFSISIVALDQITLDHNYMLLHVSQEENAH
jgi:hypothetical protein